jgi:hypothetical protein
MAGRLPFLGADWQNPKGEKVEVRVLSYYRSTFSISPIISEKCVLNLDR